VPNGAHQAEPPDHGAPPGLADYIRARQGRLLATAYALTGDPHTAEDLVQTALARLWPRWAKISAYGDPDAYVRKTMLNAYLAWRARRRFTEVGLDGPGLPDTRVQDARAAGAIARLVDGEPVMRALAQLPRRQRAVVVLRYYCDLSEADTAAVLGCAVGTVKSQHAKALAKLRVQLATRSDEEGTL
jgi:RNA polymerase sigma-70 factor (sigma-E family)